MSFNSDINKSTSKKIILFEYDLPVPVTEFCAYEAGIWYKKITPGTITITGSDGLIGSYDDNNSHDYRLVKSLKIGAEDFTCVSALADVRTQNKSFYYDRATTNIYFRFDEWDWPLDKIVLVGAVCGFTNYIDNTIRSTNIYNAYEYEKGCYYNNLFYEPRLDTVPAFNKRKDAMYFGVLQFQSASITLNNEDGYFDDVLSLGLYKQAARILFGFEGYSYSDYQTIFTGYIESYTTTPDKISFKVQDNRKGLNRTIPFRTLTKDEFPYLADGDVDKVKPIAYGQIRKAPCLCVNTDDPFPTYWQFYVADPTDQQLTSVSAVYMDGKLIDPINYFFNVALGILFINIALTDIEDNLDNITCDFIGDATVNSLDVAQDLLYLYGDISYLASNFNISDWMSARDAAQDIGLYIGKEEKVNKILESVFDASNALFFVTDNGRFTSRVYDANREPKKTIYSYEWLEDYQVLTDESQFVSSVKIEYYPNQSDEEDTYSYLNNSKEREILKRYKAYNQKNIKTCLVTEAAAIAKSDTLLSLGGEIKDIVKRKTKMQHLDLELMDFIIASPKTRNSKADDWGIYEVIGINKDFNKYEMTLEMRYIKPYDVTYTQGYLINHYLAGHRLYSQTQRI